MITFRALTNLDQPLLVDYLNDPQVVKFLSSKIPSPYTEQDAKWWVETGSKEGVIAKAVEYKGEFCGVIGVYPGVNEYGHTGEIGYWFARPFWQKGIATEAVKQYSQFIFKTTQLVRLVAPVFAGNHGSMKVLQKAGFQQEGIAQKALFKHGRFYDEHIFALIKS